MVIVGEEMWVVFIYGAICLRMRREYTILFLLPERDLKIFIIFIFKCCPYGFQEKEIQALMEQPVPPAMSFQFPFFNVLVPLDALFHMRDRIASYRYLKKISMKEQWAWLPTKKLWVVQGNSWWETKQNSEGTWLLFAQSLRFDRHSSPHNVKTPKILSTFVQVESILDPVIDSSIYESELSLICLLVISASDMEGVFILF